MIEAALKIALLVLILAILAIGIYFAAIATFAP